MVTGSQRRYDEAHPKFTLRLDPEIKDRIRRVGDENGKTMSEVTEDFILNGLNGHLNSTSSDKNDVKDNTISLELDGVIKDRVDGAKNDGHVEGYDEGHADGYDEGHADEHTEAVEDIRKMMNTISKSNFLEQYPNSVLAKELKANDVVGDDEDDDEDDVGAEGGMFDGANKYLEDLGVFG